MPVKFDAAISDLLQDIFSMSALAEHMFEAVIRTLAQGDPAPMQCIAGDEHTMDNLQLQVDDKTVEMITVYTPVAADLRLLLMIPRISGALERIGDQAEKICLRVSHMAATAPLKPVVELPKMAEIVHAMMRLSLKAFAERSTKQAAEILRMDNEVDAIHKRLADELIRSMERDPKSIGRAMDLLAISRAIERVGDHAVSIAEATIYAVIGKDIRHLHTEEAPPLA
jgi:phosphate transport system protein